MPDMSTSIPQNKVYTNKILPVYFVDWYRLIYLFIDIKVYFYFIIFGVKKVEWTFVNAIVCLILRISLYSFKCDNVYL